MPPFREDDDAKPLSSAKISLAGCLVRVWLIFFSGGRYFLITIIFFPEKLQISFAFGRGSSLLLLCRRRRFPRSDHDCLLARLL